MFIIQVRMVVLSGKRGSDVEKMFYVGYVFPVFVKNVLKSHVPRADANGCYLCTG